MNLPALLAPLVGTWRGHGNGEYPTIASFDYDDEMVFTDIGKPFLAFTERTSIDGEPRHVESGFWRMPSDGVVELIVAIPTGQGEVGSGTAHLDADGTLLLSTDSAVLCVPSAKRVDRIVRRLRVQGDTLRHELFMEAVGQGLTLHLTSEMVRS